MTGLLRIILDNPILLRELRRRMRGKALIYSIITYVIVMTAATALALMAQSPSMAAETSVDTLRAMRRTGETVFGLVTMIQFLLVLIIAPTITAGLTTGEKERKTFDFLRVTTITRWMYILGCFLSTAFYVALALVCALPLLSLVFLYGGAGFGDVIRAFFYLLCGSFVLSAFGLYISSITERTRSAQGTVVFFIFGMLVATMYGYGQYRATFAGAAAAAAGTGGDGTVYLLELPVPVWVLGCVGLVAVAALFLLLAARKLFEPEETRALGHGQFALLFAVVLGGGALVLGANPFLDDLPEATYLAVGYALLVAAAGTFAVGRMEVGDEIWHLKRHLRWLRPIDQTVPFLIVLALVWYLVVSRFSSIPVTPNLPTVFLEPFLAVTLSSFAALVAIGRAITAVTISRRRAGTHLMVVMALLLVILPLFAGALYLMLPQHQELWAGMAAFSPFAMLGMVVARPGLYTATGGPGEAAAIVYTVIAVGVALWGEWQRWRRWRNFDYHYDMPVG